jgi:cytochrome b561
MPFQNTTDRFGFAAKTIHWLTLVLLVGSFTLAFIMMDLPLSPRQLQFYAWHKWVGVTVFLVTVLRLGWRFANPVPRLPAGMPRWQRRLAVLSHTTLYAIMIVMPLTGWVMSSALNLPVVYFGLIYIPSPFGVDPALGEALKSVHRTLAVAMLVLVGVHVVAALYHHFMVRDDVMRRMLPWPSRLRASRADT